MLGKTVRFVTGTDEHGEKIAAAAASNGQSPQEFCDRIAQEYKDLWILVRARARVYVQGWAGAGAGGRAGRRARAACDMALITDQWYAWLQLGISYDAFIRTTAPQHEQLVREILKVVWDKGDIYMSDYEGWWVACVGAGAAALSHPVCTVVCGTCKAR